MHVFLSNLFARDIGTKVSGYVAGDAPDDESDADGRYRKLNEPARGRIGVFERVGMRAVAYTRSAVDGTWRVDNLAADRYYTVIGFDDRGAVNAAIQDWVKPKVYD